MHDEHGQQLVLCCKAVGEQIGVQRLFHDVVLMDKEGDLPVSLLLIPFTRKSCRLEETQLTSCSRLMRSSSVFAFGRLFGRGSWRRSLMSSG